MSQRSLEISITNEASKHFNNPKLRLQDLMEWSSAEIKPQEKEVTAFLPEHRVWVAINCRHDNRLKVTPASFK